MFLFKLALRLGRTVDELLHTISASELAEWEAFDRISPIGDDRGEFQAGLVASVVANVNGNKTAPTDFMLLSKRKPEPITDEEERSRAIAKGLGVSFGDSR